MAAGVFSGWEVQAKIAICLLLASMLLAVPVASAGWRYGSFGYGWYGSTYNGNSGYNAYRGYANSNGYGVGGCTGSWGYNVCGGYQNGYNGYGGLGGYGSYGSDYGNNGWFSISFWGT